MLDNRLGELLPELETSCPVCGGAGGETERREWTDCYRCNGAGYLPTEAGKRVLALLKHNFRPLLKETRAE